MLSSAISFFMDQSVLARCKSISTCRSTHPPTAATIIFSGIRREKPSVIRGNAATYPAPCASRVAVRQRAPGVNAALGLHLLVVVSLVVLHADKPMAALG